MPNKRRGSRQLDEELKNVSEVIAKHEKHQEKEHHHQDSASMFEVDHANSEEAKKKREERAKKARKESVAVPKNFLNQQAEHDSEDDASRQKT